MKLKLFLTGMLAFAMLSSCSNDSIVESVDNSTGSNGAGAYISVSITMPTAGGTRSQTTDKDYDEDGNYIGNSNTGIEYGKDVENKVSTLLIVLSKSDNNAYIAHSLVDANLTATNNGHYTAVGKITKTELQKFYASNPPNTKVNVFVFCNPTAKLLDVFEQTNVDNNWYDAICELEPGESVWSDNNFLMSNYSLATREFPASINEWNVYSIESNPFHLSKNNDDTEIDNSSSNGGGAIKVERSVARFDFRDGSKDYEDIAALGLPANTYPVVKGTNTDGTESNEYIINITLNKMCLVNMSKNFYYLRRVSNDGLLKDAELCGKETPGNYVVDTNADEKNSGIKTGFTTHFNYPLFEDDGKLGQPENKNWYISNISEVLNGKEDNTDSWNKKEKYSRYKIWRYVTENTIPAPNENQVNGISTGVVFKGKFVPTKALEESGDQDDKALYDALSNKNNMLKGTYEDPIIYLFGGNLYSTWNRLLKHAIKSSYNEDTKEWNRTSVLYKAIFGNGGTGEKIGTNEDGTDIYDTEEQDVESPNYLWHQWNTGDRKDDNLLKKFKKAATEAKITLYQSSKDGDERGYYCYYYYWNRHNDNNAPGEMGPMEFAVVRNNVYKLAVTKINQLGHPRNPDNDPDKPDPDTPDENGDVYMTLECEVLPWTVRVNNIEF